jgi:mRNA-degrading endonuclease RelE of RelBE toxin-antitoxin system/ribosome-binding protein aMBF1 (putative translation factor)
MGNRLLARAASLDHRAEVVNITQYVVQVIIAPEAQKEVRALPVTMRVRFDAVVTRLERWPNVSGAKPLRGALKEHFRIRMGDWRVIFKIVRPNVIVVHVAHRSTVYEDWNMKNRESAVAGTLTIRGVEYVVIPKTEYLRVQDSALPKGTVDAHAFVRESIAEDLRAAREHAKLTQAALAKRMGKSQTLVSQAEAGVARVSERYVGAVLKACGLPTDWPGPPAKKAGRSKRKN